MTTLQNFGSRFKSLDDFGEQPAWSINHNYDTSSDKYQSYMGAFLSMLVLIMTAVFLYSKAMVLYKASDVTIMMS